MAADFTSEPSTSNIQHYAQSSPRDVVKFTLGSTSNIQMKVCAFGEERSESGILPLVLSIAARIVPSPSGRMPLVL